MVIRRMWAMAAGSNIAFKIAAKPLQIETWLLYLTRYSKSPWWLHITVPCSTPNKLTCFMDRQSTYRTLRLNLMVGQKQRQ